MIEQLASKLDNLLGKFIKSENLEYCLTIILFNFIIISILSIIAYLTGTFLQMLIIGIVINVGYDRENGNHMQTLEQCIFFTTIIMTVASLIAKMTNIHPLLTIISVIALIKELPIKNRLTMLLISVLAFLNNSISCALFVAFLLTLLTSYSKYGAEIMQWIVKKLNKEK